MKLRNKIGISATLVILFASLFFINFALGVDGKDSEDPWELYKRTASTNIYLNSQTREYRTEFGVTNIDAGDKRYPNYKPLDEVVEMTNQTEEGYTIDWKGKNVTIKLSIETKQGNQKEKKNLKDWKIEKDVKEKKVLNKEKDNYHFYWEFEKDDKKAFKDTESFEIELINNTPMNITKQGNKWILDNEVVINLQDLIDTNYTLEDNGDKKVKIKPDQTKGKSFDVGKLVLDPVVVLQDADTEVLGDIRVASDEPNTNQNSESLYLGYYSGGISNVYIAFNLLGIQDSLVYNITAGRIGLWRRAHGGDSSANISVYNTTSDWDETTMNWNNAPSPDEFQSDDNDGSSRGSQRYYYFDILPESINIGSENVSYFVNYTEAWADGNFIRFDSFESYGNGPTFEITYTPYIDILTPTPSQIFTEDAPTAELNISTAVDMDVCYWVSPLVGGKFCYQESANVSDQNGDDGDCNLNYSGSYSNDGDWTYPENFYDGDWTTATIAPDFGAANYYINYSIPENVLSANWTVNSSGQGVQNTTISQDCLGGENLQLRITELNEPPAAWTYKQCLTDEGSWMNLTTDIYADNIYEEGILWEVPQDNQMAEVNSTYWTAEAGSTLLDGSHTLTFWCNETSDGTWHESDSISFDVDSVNVTTCRDLTVADREYELVNDITTCSRGPDLPAFKISNEYIGFDGNGYTVNLTSEKFLFTTSEQMFNGTTIKNLISWINFSGSDDEVFSIFLGGSHITLENLTLYPANSVEGEGVGGILMGGEIMSGALAENLTLSNIYIDFAAQEIQSPEMFGITFFSARDVSISNITVVSSGSSPTFGVSGEIVWDVTLSNLNLEIANVSQSSPDQDGVFSFFDYNNVTFRDSVVNSSSGHNVVAVFGLDADAFGFVNDSFNIINVSYIGTEKSDNSVQLDIIAPGVERQWYASIQVNDTAGDPINGATVNIYDKDNSLVASELTGADGKIDRQELTEYVNNGGTKAYSTPHTINVTKTDYVLNSTTYNLTETTNLDEVIILETSNSAPVVTLIVPDSDTNSSSSTNTLTCNNTDADGNLANSTIYLWYEGALETSQTTDITGSDNQTSYTDFGFAFQGDYEWNCYACDDAGSCDWASSNNTIAVDTLNPGITHYYENNTNSTSQSVNLTVNMTDNLGIANSTLTVYYENGSIFNQTTNTYDDDETAVNLGVVIEFIDGLFEWMWELFDWSGNSNSTVNQTITIDSTAPTVSITNPNDDQTYNSENQTINVTVSDNYIGLDTCKWTNDSGVTNTTFTCGTNITQNNLGEGGHTYTVYANDTFGNEGSDSVTFYISLGPPAITLNLPLDSGAFINTDPVNFSFTAVDSDGVDNCTLYGDFNGTWAANYTWSNITSTVLNWTEVSMPDGSYNWNVFCYDQIGTSDFSPNNRSFTLDTVVPSLVSDGFTPSPLYNENNLVISANTSDTYLDTVWLEINHSGTYENITVTSFVGDRYSYSISSSLVDNFENISWYWHSNDSAGNINTTDLINILVTNRNPYNVTILTANDSWFNSNTYEINFTANDPDEDILTYTIYNSTDGVVFNTAGSTTDNNFTLSGLNNTHNVSTYYYVSASDGDLSNTSSIYILTSDTISPDATLLLPEASPFPQCSLTDIALNYTWIEENIDYCTFNVTSGGLATTENTNIPGCTNVTFTNALDSSTPLINFVIFDKAGNSETTSYLIRMDTNNALCPEEDTGPTGGGGSPYIEPTPDYGFCGDDICNADRGETFFNCAKDCSEEFEVPNLEQLFFSCLAEDEHDQCIWYTNPGILWMVILLVIIFLTSILFEFKPEAKGTKKWVFRSKRKR